MKTVSDRVAAQYERYSYPPPIKDLTLARNQPERGDPKYFAAHLFPEGLPRPDLRILSAGCGSNQAAHLAYNNRTASVVGIDLSDASLANQRQLASKHGLTNLKVEKRNILDVAQMGQQFDLIVCTGVIHHMEQPDAGLQALASVLAPSDAIHTMVYASSRRSGIYFLQDMFRRLGVKQDPEGVAFVRRALKALPPYHYTRWFLHGMETIGDAELVDIFLHPQDRAYSVQGVLDLAADAGLAFQGWSDNGMYYRDAFISQSTELWPRLARVSDADEWSVVDDLMLHNFKHSFVLRHQSEGEPWRVDFDRGNWQAYKPVRHPFLSGQGGQFKRQVFELSLAGSELAMMLAANGQLSIIELAAAHGASADQARDLFRRMWRLGHVFCLTR